MHSNLHSVGFLNLGPHVSQDISLFFFWCFTHATLLSPLLPLPFFPLPALFFKAWEQGRGD